MICNFKMVTAPLSEPTAAKQDVSIGTHHYYRLRYSVYACITKLVKSCTPGITTSGTCNRPSRGARRQGRLVIVDPRSRWHTQPRDGANVFRLNAVVCAALDVVMVAEVVRVTVGVVGKGQGGGGAPHGCIASGFCHIRGSRCGLRPHAVFRFLDSTGLYRYQRSSQRSSQPSRIRKSCQVKAFGLCWTMEP